MYADIKEQFMKNKTMIRFFILFTFIFMFPGTITAQEVERPKIEVVFVLDSTGSMSDLINAAKDKIWSISSTLATAEPAPELKIGLIAYRDIEDNYVTKITDLTSDLDLVYANLMDFTADGGGDMRESVNQALHEAVTQIKWNSDSKTYKVIFLVGDAPPHMDYQNDVSYKKSCREAKKREIIINTIQCGTIAETTPVWKEIASSSNGEYFLINNSNSHVDYETPYDAELAELSRKIEGTQLYYGSEEIKSINQERQLTKDKINSASKDTTIAQRLYFNSTESGMINFYGSNELLNDLADNKISLEAIEEKDLPEQMQIMSDQERKEYIEKLIKIRKQCENEIKILNKKRQEYIREQVKADSNDDTFDDTVYKSLKEQGAEKNIDLNEGLVY